MDHQVSNPDTNKNNTNGDSSCHQPHNVQQDSPVPASPEKQTTTDKPDEPLPVKSVQEDPAVEPVDTDKNGSDGDSSCHQPHIVQLDSPVPASPEMQMTSDIPDQALPVKSVQENPAVETVDTNKSSSNGSDSSHHQPQNVQEDSPVSASPEIQILTSDQPDEPLPSLSPLRSEQEDPAVEPAKAKSVHPLIGKKVYIKWLGVKKHFFYAEITDYDPAKGKHKVVYDPHKPSKLYEWIDLKEVLPEDIQWDIINDSCISNKKEQTKPYIIDGDNIPFTDLPDDSLCLPDLPEDQVENFVVSSMKRKLTEEEHPTESKYIYLDN
ncbi:uncharacterized protein [Cicer arietinum]|uniref:uncharacterized protein n=1 Tax=Cicer arietinum TaxID=3827 RepID=UPI00032A524D